MARGGRAIAMAGTNSRRRDTEYPNARGRQSDDAETSVFLACVQVSTCAQAVVVVNLGMKNQADSTLSE